MVGNTLAYFLKRSNKIEANHLLFDLFHTAYRNKQLKGFTSLEERVALIIDGTQCFESTIKHYDNCTTVVRNNTTYYQYRLLIASTVNIKTHDTVVVAIEPIENKDGSTKNDCEMNSAKRLLERIKEYNPWMKYIVLADGLYVAASVIKQIKSYNWEAVITLKDENMDIFKVADCRFGNKNRDEFYSIPKEKEAISLWFEPESLSDFWNGLDLPIYVGKRKIEIINKEGRVVQGSPIKTTFFISTIPLNKHNIKTISKLHRARWGIENTTINNLKNQYNMDHIFVYASTAMVWLFASIAMNLFTLFRLRNHMILNSKYKTYQQIIDDLVAESVTWSFIKEVFARQT